MDIRTVGVVGAGTMGNGNRSRLRQMWINVVLVDVEPRFVDGDLQTISKNLEHEVAKNRLTPEQREPSLARITGTTIANAWPRAILW